MATAIKQNLMQELLFAPESEEAAIGCLLIDNDTRAWARDSLPANSFYLDKHQWIAESVYALKEERKAVDIVTVMDHLERRQLLDEIGGAAYITQLIHAVPSALHFRTYAETVVDLARRRQLVEYSSLIAQAAFDVSSPCAARVNELCNQASTASLGRMADTMTAKEAVEAMYERVIHNIENPIPPPGVRGMTTGVNKLDYMLGGLRTGVYLWAAVTHTGKTQAMLALARHILALGEKVLFVTPEMTPDQLIERMACGMSGVHPDDVDSGLIDSVKLGDLHRAQGELAMVPLIITQSKSLPRIRALVYKIKPKLIILDGIELMDAKASGLSDNTYEARGQVVTWGLGLTKEPEVDATMCITTQIATKQLSTRMNKEPEPGDVYGSSEPEYATDGFITIHRPGRWFPTEPQDKVKLTLWKNRLRPRQIPSSVTVRLGLDGKLHLWSDEKPPPLGWEDEAY